jgi:hypothetical protein
MVGDELLPLLVLGRARKFSVSRIMLRRRDTAYPGVVSLKAEG